MNSKKILNYVEIDNKNAGIKKKYVIENDIDLVLDEKTGNSTICFGSSKTGKSTLCMYLYNKYYKKNPSNIAIMFSPNHHALKNVTSNNKVSNKLIRSSKYEPSIIEDMQKIQRRTDNKYDFFVCLDDTIDKKEDKMLKNLVLTYRNSNISSFICLQDCTLLAKSLRNNANNILFFAFRSDECIEDTINRYFRSYLKDYKTMSEKIKWYRKMTDDHKFIYLNTRTYNISFHKIII